VIQYIQFAWQKVVIVLLWKKDQNLSSETPAFRVAQIDNIVQIKANVLM